MRSSELVQVFRDTLETIETNAGMKQTAENVCRGTLLYEEGFFSAKKPAKDRVCKVSVQASTTFKCAHSFVGSGKIAVLNFANPIEPGGGSRRGAKAQEECLCRCSDLYLSLTQAEPAKRYYQAHAGQNHDYLFSDRIIYSPGVTVFKDDDTYELLPDPFQVDVLTCAAPYNARPHDIEVLTKAYVSRLTNIFEAAVEHEIDVLILGAFGCGVFNNPPDLMAQTFKDLIAGKYNQFFDSICFAIKASSTADRNYSVFLDILG